MRRVVAILLVVVGGFVFPSSEASAFECDCISMARGVYRAWIHSGWGEEIAGEMAVDYLLDCVAR
jgi:hypothetical protein